MALASCAPAVEVADGDTIIAGGTHYRLWGIDAPELRQMCPDGWPAGAEARRALAALIGEHSVVCEPRGYDRYRRIFGVCRIDGQDLGAIMVNAGMAWASQRYSPAYLQVEKDARDDGRGLHAHDCVPSWQWRAEQRQPSRDRASGE